MGDRTCLEDGCDRPSRSRGRCQRCYTRWYRSRAAADVVTTGSSTPLAERLWRKVDKTHTGGCWIWTGARLPAGYGNIYDPARRTQVLTHRAAYELVKGPIPDGLQLDHLCHNPPCCNPDHLEPVTQQINAIRGYAPSVAAGRRKTHCHLGHEFSEANTHVTKTGGRICLACHRNREKARREAARAKG